MNKLYVYFKNDNGCVITINGVHPGNLGDGRNGHCGCQIVYFPLGVEALQSTGYSLKK